MKAELPLCWFARSCKKAKSTIQSLGLDDGAVGILELDEIRDGAEIQDYLESETGGSAFHPAGSRQAVCQC